MSTDRDLMHPRDAIMRTMERIYRYRMTTTSGGNLSIRDDDDSNRPADASLVRAMITVLATAGRRR